MTIPSHGNDKKNKKSKEIIQTDQKSILLVFIFETDFFFLVAGVEPHLARMGVYLVPK